MTSLHSTLLESLQQRASAASGTADTTAFSYFSDGEQLTDEVTFADLDRRAREIAAHLQTLTNPGDRVLLVYPPSLDYIRAFFGCVYAGVIAVPALPPASARTLPRLRLIAEDAQPRIALTSSEVVRQLHMRQADHGDPLSQLPWVAIDTWPDTAPPWNPPDLRPSDIVFLQYTSGSTGSPKGVMVSHANCLANIHAIDTAVPLPAGSRLVSWLPPHHDMGLIGKILFPMHMGHHCVQFPPAAFLKRPYRWLRLISEYRAGLTAAPNFAYELCVEKISAAEKQTLDLSSLRFAANGSEPIRPGTLERFSRAFAVCGFRPEANTPVYGLAESTLLVAANTRKVPATLPSQLAISKAALALDEIKDPDGELDTLQVASVGVAADDHQVIIVNPSSRVRQADQTVGEIWVRGPSVARGYWNRPEESQRTFAARLAGRDEIYMRTGDLGFIRGGELYIAGRLKDMMIFNGRNVYPQDVEETVEQLDPAFRISGCAAFSLEEGTATQLVIVQEIEPRGKPRFETLAGAIRAAIAEQHEVVDIAAVVLVSAGQIPRTTSGKIQRARCKSLFLANELEPTWSWKNAPAAGQPSAVPEGETETAIAAIWRDLLGLEQVGRHDDFFQRGGHSLAAAQLAVRLRQAFGIDLSLRDLFTHSTIAGLGQLVSHTGATPLADIPRADRTQPLPLSWAQQRLWFLDQLDPAASTAYHIPVGLRLTGTLNHAALHSALNRILTRHEGLRSTFVNSGGQPIQVVAPVDTAFALIEHDLRDLSGDRQRDRVATLIQATVSQPFDLASGPLIRGELLQLADHEHILLIIQHHIGSDGWSISLLVRELTTLYTAFSRDLPDPLAPLPLQYADYAAWQRDPLQGEALQTQLDYWRRHLADAPALLELPTDHPRPAQQSFAGASIPLALPTELTAGLRALSQQHGTTLFMTLLAGWSILLMRISGQRDLVIGAPVANRQRIEFEALIGLFINTLSLRLKLDDTASVADVLQRVKALTLEAYAHQDVPFERVVEALQPARSLSYNPVFQVRLAWIQPPKASELALPGLQLEPMHLPQTTTPLDLSLVLSDSGATITGALEYATALFEPDTVERLAGCLQTLLAAMVADASQPIGTLDLLSPRRRQQLLVDWNATARPAPDHPFIHQRFEAQVAACPNAPALVYQGRTLTYAEVNARANQLARHLLSLGIRPDDRVAICLQRGLDMVIGLLGILKAGGAYVPLDPEYPEERLGLMLTDSAPVVLLTQTAIEDCLPAMSILRVLALDDANVQAVIDSHPSDDIDPTTLGLAPEHLAYVIYTSGSTGKPKGVMNIHRGLTNLAHAQIDFFDVRPDSRVLQFASFSFDACISEIAMALGSGACLHLVPQEALQPGEPLTTTLRQNDITHVTLPPSVLATLPTGTDFAPMTLIVAGEACPAALARQWTGKHRLINAYGPTENTVCASAYLCQGGETGAVPIGRPIANTTLYLLDAHRQPVPIGVTGEIHIGGVQVARGYLNRPDLTEERFLPDPFSTVPRARMYKTGDLGRQLPDGNMVFLSRNDFQVKIRGFRIELGEIEAQLLACPGVRDAVVIAREDNPGDKRLVAYLVPEEGIELSIEPLRAQLASVLADYMVPAAYVILPSLPLTPNSKVDRRALPAPESGAYLKHAYEAPAGEIEIAIAGIWQDLLRVDQVGRQDHFFELGGHSLLVVTFIERLRQLGMTADVRSVFAAPTLAAIAAVIAADQGRTPGVVIPPNLIPADSTAVTSITPAMLPLISLTQTEIDRIVATVPHGMANVQDIYPLAPSQEGILFHHLLNTAGDAYLSRVVIAFDSRHRLDTFLDALQQVIERHDILRTAFLWSGLSQPVQVVCRQAQLPIHEWTLDPDNGAAEQLLARTDPRRLRLDVQRAPLLAAHIAFDSEFEMWLLSLLNHHLVCDHVTIERVLAEIQMLLREEPGTSLPPALPYRNFIATVGSERVDDHEAYFRRQLGNLDEPTTPFGLLNVRDDGARSEEARLHLSDDLAQRVRRQAREQGVTPAVLFHVAWAQVIATCSARDDVVFGTVLSGRLQGSAGADQVLGMFINTLPIRIPLVGRTAAGVVTDTHQRLSELLNHEQASLALAQRCSGVSAAVPLFTCLLNYRHSRTDAATLSWEGTRVLVAEERTNYPLTLDVDDLDPGFILTARCVDGISPARMTAHVQSALNSLVTALERPIQQPLLSLSTLPAQERQQLLVDWNATATPYPQDQLVHQLFEAQVAQNPGAIALVYEDRSLTYGELNARANQLAHHLLGLGVRPDDRIALHAHRSLDMVVGLLGILKAGGAYVPIDPEYPQARQHFMLSDCAPVALLTQPLLKDTLPPLDIPVVVLDTDTFSEHPTHNPDPDALGLQPTHLAYVLYTSGSTGRPKGVMNQHDGVVNRLLWARDEYGVTSQDRILQKTPFSFDVSGWEFFLPLLAGARLVMARPQGHLDPQYLLDSMTRAGITLVHFVPSMLAAFLDHPDFLEQHTFLKQHSLEQPAQPPCPTLRHVLCSGEALPYALQRRCQTALPHVELHNLYGPTEAAIDVTSWRCRCDQHVGVVPIGRPVANTRIYLLDAQRHPVPIGVAGEIYIGGVQVARGYLNRPELTEERFLPDPFSSAPDARMYKTGDLGRYLPDGNLLYLGRNDFQVKIRGFRIELGEIEAQLLAAPGVREAVVIAREDSPGDKRLVAYLVPAEAAALSVEELRGQLATTLAEYMVPAAYVTLASLPLTSNGKLDRRALPAPEADSYIARSYEAPIGELETNLAAIWRELLQRDGIGRQDNFFELGGHSLLATKLTLRIQNTFNLNFPLIEVFQRSTLSTLAMAVSEMQLSDFDAEEISRTTAKFARLSEDELQQLLEEDIS